MNSPIAFSDNDKRDNAERTRVLVVASVRLYRDGMAFNLEGREGLHVVGSAASRQEALSIVSALKPDVVVIDMATDRSLELVGNLKEIIPRLKIIAFAVKENDPEIIACAEAGVDGYVTPEGSMDDLTSTIMSVTRGELLCSPRIAAILLRRVSVLAKDVREPHPACDLTSREYEIVGLIEGGLSNKEIAMRLHIEVSTVKNHVHNLLEKLNVTSRAEAAAYLGIRSTGQSRLFALSAAAARAT